MPDQTDLPVHPDQAKWDAARDASEARYAPAAPITDEQLEGVGVIRDAVTTLGTCILALVPSGPQRAIALTDLESVLLRANRGLLFPTIPQEQHR